jgi:hypothetical protein
VDTSFLDGPEPRMKYLNVLIDYVSTELPSQRKAHQLAFFLYRALRIAIKIENAGA